MTRHVPVTGSPARPSVRDLITVHRLEFPFGINTACQALWGACFAVAGPGGLLDPAVVAAVMATLAVLLGGLVLNTAVDLDSDRRHAERGGLAGAARRLGRTAGLRLAGAEFTLGLVLSSAVSVWTGRWLVAGAVAAAVGTQVLYNVDPVRLKARGQAGPVAFSSGVIAFPFLATYAAVDGVPPVELWPVFGGLTVLAVGRVVWWSVPDVDADAAAGLCTTGVRRGAAGALVLASLVLAAGSALLAAGLWWSVGPVAAAVGTAGHLLFLGTVVPLLRRVARGGTVRSRRLRTTAMPLVMVADVLIVAVGLLSG